ncbi:hypothetical protein NTE_03379 [Candidatus Nitrososphaera evergladensis SR1]|uniref:PrgI family protein n=1 Tax=Candidatus Nitrososphaera evergladensis SR1 TaxID=1459636 RepID=A0A075MXS3_9ARCH|nr:PrgI family protein [Candidatus Nitrososphaera evergladensis]AIF85407.1 hypothetical protein NTE_03379 [Candidatus Nitrososphaera evergladensis SR1]
MVGQVDVLWFESMGVFSEPIFNFSFVRLTLRQVGTLFGGLLFAYALSTGLDQSVSGAAIACLALLVTFYRPRVMPLEQYFVAATRFLAAKNQRVTEKQRVALLMANNVAEVSEPESESNRARYLEKEPLDKGTSGFFEKSRIERRFLSSSFPFGRKKKI